MNTIFEAICAISKMMVVIIISVHELFRYLRKMVFIGAFVIVLIVIHIIVKIINLVDLIFLKFDHFCFELGIREIV